MNNNILRAAMVWLLWLTIAFTVKADENGEPLWEFGVGAVFGSIPDYPAADENTFRALGFPFGIYRGEFLRADRDSVRGRFLETSRYELDVTLSAAFPVDSDNNAARRGMPDLDLLLGIGPQLKVKLIDEPDAQLLNLNLQLRAVFSTDFSSIDERGFVFNPRLSYRRSDITPLKLRFRAFGGPVWATERLMDYFYEVDPEFALSDRPAFGADAGYLGSNFSFAVSRSFTRSVRVFVGAGIGVYSGAANQDSPLYRDELTVSVFSGFVWSIWKSKELVRD
ncbi:MAG: MipA/OmpV family protein [Gammaproteobacteria bacterium]